MSDTGSFAITAEWTSTEVVVVVRGELDLSASAGWDACVNEILVQVPTAITVDLEATTFVDSSGLRLLLLLTQHARAAGIRFAAANIPPAVARLLEITGLSELVSGALVDE